MEDSPQRATFTPESENEPRTSRKAAWHLYIVLLILLFISAYTYILQRSYRDNTLEAAVDRDITCSDAVHQVLSNKLQRDDFTQINTVEDMQTAHYQMLQAQLNEVRSMNSTRYLYTAKRNDEGRLIYLVDGLDLGAEDFAYPGTYIEDEMIPYIETALSGETVYSQEIVDTTWGHIFTACYPVTAADGSGDIIGALCIEMDMEDSYRFVESSNRTSVLMAFMAMVVALLLIVCFYLSFEQQKKREQRQQKQLEESAAAAEAANKAKSTFLFNMSHDIRTPMNAIIGFAELAGKHLNEPDLLADYIGNIRTCSQKLLTILDNVLELARIENNKIMLEENVVPADECLDSCVVMFDAALSQRHQTLTVTKNLPHPYIYLDSAHMTEIMLNLISNAIKYTADGGAIHCSLSQKTYPLDGWCTLVFSAADNGIGMSEEFQRHIFESFSRERSSTNSGVEGTGLGMGIVKKLVDLMSGTIQIQSKLGVGSTFTVAIPCRIASKEDAQPKRAAETVDNSALVGKHILLAEDNDLNAEIAIELLGEAGLTVDRAENGVACVGMVEKAAPYTYSLILMDIQMPIMDGYTATQKIRRLEDPAKANIPIIAMTANAFAEDRQKALDAGMNDHVAKPIDMNKLIPTLLKYL